MDISRSNVIFDIAKTASLLSKQLLDLNGFLQNHPDKLKMFNYATPSSSGYNSAKASSEHLNMSNNADEAYFSSKKNMSLFSSTSSSTSMCSLPVSSTKNVHDDSSLNMSCGSMLSSSSLSSSLARASSDGAPMLLTSSVNSANRIKKRLFAELDNNTQCNKYATPQLPQNKVEPKVPRIKETRKAKLQFRLKLLKKFAKHRAQLRNFIGSRSSATATAIKDTSDAKKSCQLTASTPFKIK